MPLLFILYAIAIACCVHAVRTGQPMYWMFVCLAFPGFGSLIYVIAVVLPSLASSRGAAKAGAAVRDTLDPQRDARDAIARLEVARTGENLLRAGQTLLASNRPGEALELLQEAMAGAHADDPAIMHAYARAQFETGDAAGARETLERLKEENPTIRDPEAHLLYARALEAGGREEEALTTYEAVSIYYPGAEARARWALLLQRTGRNEEAQERWSEILAGAKIAPQHVRQAQREWIAMARQHAV